MAKRRPAKENYVRIGNLTVVSNTQDLNEVVKAANTLIRKNKNLISNEPDELPPMFG